MSDQEPRQDHHGGNVLAGMVLGYFLARKNNDPDRRINVSRSIDEVATGFLILVALAVLAVAISAFYTSIIRAGSYEACEPTDEMFQWLCNVWYLHG